MKAFHWFLDTAELEDNAVKYPAAKETKKQILMWTIHLGYLQISIDYLPTSKRSKLSANKVDYLLRNGSYIDMMFQKLYKI